MAIVFPKHETRIRIPASPAWTLRLTDTDGTNIQITIPAGFYYWGSIADGGLVSFAAALATALNNGAGVTYTVAVDDNGIAGTGQVTITVSAGVFAIVWETLALRDLLGFTADIPAGASATSTGAVKYLWLPNCARTPMGFPDPIALGDPWGVEEFDYRAPVAPSGVMSGSTFNTRNAGQLRYDCLYGYRVKQALRTRPNEDLQTWMRDLMSIGGPPFRYYPDRASDALWVTLNLDESAAQFNVQPSAMPNWMGPRSLWTWQATCRQYRHV